MVYLSNLPSGANTRNILFSFVSSFFFIVFFLFLFFYAFNVSSYLRYYRGHRTRSTHGMQKKKNIYIYIFIYKGERNISPDKKTKRLIGKLYINLASLDISYNLTTQQLLFHFFFFSFSLVINTTLILLQFVIESTVSNIILYIYIYV